MTHKNNHHAYGLDAPDSVNVPPHIQQLYQEAFAVGGLEQFPDYVAVVFTKQHKDKMKTAIEDFLVREEAHGGDIRLLQFSRESKLCGYLLPKNVFVKTADGASNILPTEDARWLSYLVRLGTVANVAEVEDPRAMEHTLRPLLRQVPRMVLHTPNAIKELYRNVRCVMDAEDSDMMLVCFDPSHRKHMTKAIHAFEEANNISIGGEYILDFSPTLPAIGFWVPKRLALTNEYGDSVSMQPAESKWLSYCVKKGNLPCGAVKAELKPFLEELRTALEKADKARENERWN